MSWAAPQWRSSTFLSGLRLPPVAASPELLDQPGVGRLPLELGTSPGRLGSLVEEEHLREVVPDTRTRLVFGAGDGTRRTDGEVGRLRGLCAGWVESVPDHIEAACGVVLEHPPEEVGQIRDVHRRPVLAPRAEHDEVAGGIAR